MIITPNNCFSLKPDVTFPNIVHGLGNKLAEIDEVKGMQIEGQLRKTVTSKIFNRIHSFIKLNKNDKMTNLDDIITYFDVSFVNKTALPIMYKAVTGLDLPPIVMESHLMNKFIMEGTRSLHDEEKPFFKKNYSSGGFFLRKPSFSGSSVVNIDDMAMFHKIQNFETDFDDLIGYISNAGDIIDVGDDYFMNFKSHAGEKFVMDNVGKVLAPLIKNEKHIIIDKKFSDEQEDSVRGICTSTERIDCLTGKAGYGKTFVISNIVNNVAANAKHIVCCAFTGKAASRMEQSDVDISKILFPPKTIHSLMATLKMQEGVTDIDLVIIDEASTLNSALFADLLRVLENHSTLHKIKFIMVGDTNQLPPIGGGQPFEDIMKLKLFPTYTLTKNFRTADPKMIALYDDVLSQKYRVDPRKHSKFFNGYHPHLVGDKIQTLVSKLFEKDKMWFKDNKCIILSHTNKYVDYINYLCYKNLTGKNIGYYEYTFDDHPDDLEFDWEPIPWAWKGAKLIFTKNDRIDVEINGGAVRVTNGTVAEIIGFNKDLVHVRSYDDGSEFYIEGDYDTVKLAYAMTVYKSQGSEAQYVIYFHSNHIFESKRLAYTAMTRAQQNVKIYTPFDGFQMSMDVPRITNINSQ